MKAERREETQDNALAKKIVELPDFGRKWAGRAALAAAALVIVGALIYNRMNAAEARHREAADQLFLASELATFVRFTPPSPERPIDERYVGALQTQYDKGRAAVEQVREKTTDPKLLAQADVILGDLAYALGSLPTVPAAATRPAEFSPRPPRDELMKQAAAAFQDVVDHYKDQTVNLAAAQFGLAAIAENRGEWDAAKSHYESIRTNADMAPLYKQLAENRVNALPMLRQAALLKASEVSPLMNPTTAPAAGASALAPTTAMSETTKPAAAAATTKPSATTKPATTAK